MQLEIPLNIIFAIVDHVRPKSALYNLCLTSKTFNLAATPYLYEKINVGYERKGSIVKNIAWLSKFGSLPPSLLRHVKTFTVTPTNPDWPTESLSLAMSKGVEDCLEKMTRLRSFTWDNTTVFRPKLLSSLKSIENLTDLSIVLPLLRNFFGLSEYKILEGELSGFRNLKTLELHGLWVPNLEAIRRLVPILRNSPSLETLVLSLDEDRLHFWEFRDEYDDTDQEGEWTAEKRDFEIKQFFAMLCLEYRSTPIDDSDKTDNRHRHPPFTPELSLKRLDLGISCLLTMHVHQLTNTEALEDLAISNRDLKIWGEQNPYETLDPADPDPFIPALAIIKTMAPNLRRVCFENFDYEVDGKGLDIYSNFPDLKELVVGEVGENLEEDLQKCGAGGKERLWRKLELSRSMWGNNPFLGGRSKYEKILGFIAKCEALTELAIEILRGDWDLLLETLSKLPHLRTLDVSVSRKDAERFPDHFNEEAVRTLFNHHCGLHIVRVYSGPRVERDASEPLASTWRRNIHGIEELADEELTKEWLERDPVHYFNRKERLLFEQ